MLPQFPTGQWTETQRRLALQRAYSLILSWPAKETTLRDEVAPDKGDTQSNPTARPDSSAIRPLMPALTTGTRAVRPDRVGAEAIEKALQQALRDDALAGASED